MREKYYKTQLCVNFTQGQCTYGARCTFAHGELELRQRASAPASSVPPGKGRWVSDTWWGEQWKDGPQWSKDAWGQSGGGGGEKGNPPDINTDVPMMCCSGVRAS